MTQQQARRSPSRHRDDWVRGAAAVVGSVLLFVGLAAFVPGVTTDHDSMATAGPTSHAHLLGVFQVSVLHNVVHLLLGAAGLASARSARSAVVYLVGGGGVYLLLCVHGLLVADRSAANVLPVNGADDWLHLVLGVLMVGFGLVGHRAAARPSV